MDTETRQGHSLHDVVKLDLKVLAAPGATVETEEFIPVFHRWITERVLPELLIDVADYSHVHEGPGVLLVGHDAIYSFDEGRGETGLLYSRRRETSPGLAGIDTLGQRLLSVLDSAFRACRLIEEEPGLEGRITFDRHRLELPLNDRRAPSDDGAAAALQTAFEQALATAGVSVEGRPVAAVRVGEPRERLTLRTGQRPQSAGPGRP